MRRLSLIPILLVTALGTACASGGAVPHPFPMPGSTRLLPPVRPPASPPAEPDGTTATAETAAAAAPRADEAEFRAIVDTALGLRGTPYKDGGDTPGGFDCSGFTQYVFAQHGLTLPRAVREQFTAGQPIDPSADLLAGDLLFFTTTEPGATHVAISLGGDEFVHAPSSKGVVRVEKLTTGYWNERFLGARRL